VGGLPSTWEKALETARQRLEAVLDADRGALGVVLSAQHTNEDNWVLLRLAREFLRLDKIYIAGKRPVPTREDKILRVADVNPNQRGARALGGEGATSLNWLETDLANDKLRGLIILGADVPLSEELLWKAEELDAVVAISSHERDLAAHAHVALPAASWAEVHGTITNKDGRVQRLRPAFPPLGQALPAWEVLLRLGRKLGAAFEYPYPRAIFQELVARVPEMAGAEWGKDAPLVQLRFAGSRG
jgi:NADH-quinone oxidoreductase subunit G